MVLPICIYEADKYRLPQSNFCHDGCAGREYAKHLVSVIHLKGYATFIPDNSKCSSACAIAWLGGVMRIAGRHTHIGFPQRYFAKGDTVDVLEVLVDDPEATNATIDAMKAAGIQGLNFTDWRERNQSFFTVLEVERNMMFIILSVIVVVAAFNIISGLIMLVKDKGREIGILRTMGATQGAIMRVFLSPAPASAWSARSLGQRWVSPSAGGLMISADSWDGSPTPHVT
jgi:hypothetical protein